MNKAIESALVELINFELFKSFDKDTLSLLCEDAQIVVSSHKMSLFEAGQIAGHFYIVLTGAYKLCKSSPHGDETIVYFSTPGDVIAALVMAKADSSYPVNAISMGPSRCVKIAKHNFTSVWQKHPELIMSIQAQLSTRMGFMQNQKTLSKSPLSTKVANLLLEILNKSSNHELLLPIPLTRKDIADSLGSTVESVIRVMSAWSKLGYIETKEQQVFVLNVAKIIEESQKN